MNNISTEWLLIIISVVVVVSYLFTILSRYIKVPSVLLLLAAGMALRAVAQKQGWNIYFPTQLMEFLGVTGLVMIVLEAGLDLKLSRNRVQLIRNAFLSAIVILVVSMALISGTLYLWLGEPLIKCIVYSIPLSIMSSSIVIPSLHHISPLKKEFLVYEASFSDIIGLLLFNLFTARQTLTAGAVAEFGFNIVVGIVLSVIFAFFLFLIITRSTMNVRFFVVFGLLIFLYVGGKMLHLPSLLIILLFGLMMNNWSLVPKNRVTRLIPEREVASTTRMLHALTAETSFLVRTFFFLVFGYSIGLEMIASPDVVLLGSVIVAILLLVRFLYLRFFLRANVYPEVIFIPRGLITILLFYKIPRYNRLESFNEAILFYIILLTGLIMMIGLLFYKPAQKEVLENA